MPLRNVHAQVDRRPARRQCRRLLETITDSPALDRKHVLQRYIWGNFQLRDVANNRRHITDIKVK